MNNSQIYLILKLKSFHPYYLNRFVYNASKKFRAFFPVFEQQVFLPKRVERFTVLRSPHVDKKARDQMERCVHQRIICWSLPYSEAEKNFSVLFVRMFRVFAALAVGVEFRVEYITATKTLSCSQNNYNMKKRKI